VLSGDPPSSPAPTDPLAIELVTRIGQGLREPIGDRYYEPIGLLPEPHRVSGQRRYGDDTRKRLEFIAVAQQARFILHEIVELSDGFDSAAWHSASCLRSRPS
jgi:hypothetical protein